MSKPPLTPEEKESYARRLKATLQTRRPRKSLRMLIALLGLAVVVAVIWRLNRPPIESPPVVLASLDAVGCVGQPVRAEAWVKILDVPPEKSAGLTVRWEFVGRMGDLPAAKSDAQGVAKIELPALAAESVLTVQAWTQEPEQRSDRGRIFVFAPKSKVVIVPIAPLPGDHVLFSERDVAPNELRSLIDRKADGWRFVYAATADDPVAYRTLRDWLRRQVQRGLPDGPLLQMRVTDGKEIALDVVSRTLADPAILWEP
jgi:hypothetical protein